MPAALRVLGQAIGRNWILTKGAFGLSFTVFHLEVSSYRRVFSDSKVSRKKKVQGAIYLHTYTGTCPIAGATTSCLPAECSSALGAEDMLRWSGSLGFRALDASYP